MGNDASYQEAPRSMPWLTMLSWLGAWSFIQDTRGVDEASIDD